MKGSNSFIVHCRLLPWVMLNNLYSVCVKVVFAVALLLGGKKKDRLASRGTLSALLHLGICSEIR